jgi:hypothetical protein
MNETELTTLLERGSHLQEPDVDALVAGGAARGRRSLRRRRVGTASVAVLATAGIATCGLFLTGGDVTARDSSVSIASSPSPAPPTTRRVVDTDDNGPVEVTAELRSITEIHSDIQRLLGPGASNPLTGLSRPLVHLGGDDLSWFYRFDDAEAQVNVHPVPYGCTPPGEEIAHQTGCLATESGVEYRTAGPWANDGGRSWGQTVVSWQHGFEIMVISTNVHQELTSDDSATARPETTRVADQPTITMDQLVALATSDIWFEPAAD